MSSRGSGIRAIARASGFSTATVSLALRGSPRVAPATRDKILKAASRLGYTPDPRVSRVMKAVRDSRQGTYLGNLACVCAVHPSVSWRQPMVDAAIRRAKRLGYGLEFHFLDEKHSGGKRLGRILHNRGIKGVLVSPWRPEIPPLEMDWNLFATVIIGFTFDRQWGMHRVARSLFLPTQILIERLKTRGYRRIGICQDLASSERMRKMPVAAWKALNDPACLPPLITPGENQGKLLSWIRKMRPDVVVGEYWVLNCLKNAGFRIPEDLAFFCLNRDARDGETAGIYPDFESLAAAGVDLLVECVESGQTGIPDHARMVLIDGDWTWGSTVKALKRQTGGPKSRQPRAGR